MNDFNFKRLFSLCMFKNKKLNLAQMSFAKDFINTDKGNPYPVMYKSDELDEYVSFNKYYVNQGTVSRFFCQFFPFATYEISLGKSLMGAGFEFKLPNADFRIIVAKNRVYFNIFILC